MINCALGIPRLPFSEERPMTESAVDDEALSRLRTDFPGWRHWRAIKPDGGLGEWVATRHDPAAGVSATVMQPTAALMRVALAEERREREQKGPE